MAGKRVQGLPVLKKGGNVSPEGPGVGKRGGLGAGRPRPGRLKGIRRSSMLENERIGVWKRQDGSVGDPRAEESGG